MEKRVNIDIRTKARQCLNFVCVICLLGISIPMAWANHIYRETSPYIGDISIALAFIPIFSAFISFVLYHHNVMRPDNVQNESDSSSKQKSKSEKNERLGDIILYIAGLLSILLIAAFIGLSGGIKNNIMAYYFFFIPSATAVAFTTRLGLWIVGISSFVCVSILYYFFYDSYGLVDPGRLHYWGFSIYQVFLIVLLEYFTNFLDLYDLIGKKLLN